LIIVIF